MDSEGMLQIFARLVDGKTAVLQFSSGIANGREVKEKIFNITGIPPSLQRLISSGYQLGDESVILRNGSTVNVALRLPGGKGGFGSLLRGAATKAGHKKTNNFDACRDMSGRRLRHVNAEKLLEEWKAGEEERKLEKIAEDFLKNEAKKRGGNKLAAAKQAADKYVTGYREQSAKCVGAVEEAVKEVSDIILKRKSRALPCDNSDSKKLKIWLGKRKLGESDSECSSDDEDNGGGSKESMVTSINCDEKVEEEGSSDSVTGNFDEKDPIVEHNATMISDLATSVTEKEIEECNDVTDSGSGGNSEIEGTRTESLAADEKTCYEKDVTEGSDVVTIKEDVTEGSDAKLVAVKQDVTEGIDVKLVTDKEDVKQINLEDYSSASELEALGMETLKHELNSRGLKCGGTLQERAARLFLLKTTPFDQLPKKLIARK